MRKVIARSVTPQHKPGVMNKTEAAYAQHLDVLKEHGAILAWKFEILKFRLADRTYYTPDFAVVNLEGVIEFHEVKGFMRDDAAVKIKAAGELVGEWFIFKLEKKGKGGSWDIQQVGR